MKIARHNNTLKLQNPEKDINILIPILQVSEIFALEGTSPDNAALSLLSEKIVPLHIFDKGHYKGTWMPYISIVSGQVSMAQYMVLFDEELTLPIAQEVVRGACRLRCGVARKWFPKDYETWEERYLNCLSEFYANPRGNAQKIFKAINSLDEKRLAKYISDLSCYSLAEGIAKATVVSAFSRLSLDPWISVFSHLSIPFNSLWDDLFFLFKPLLLDLWLPMFSSWSGDVNEIPELYRKHFTKNCAQDGKKSWSLRMLPVREGYALISHFMGNASYRAARRVIIPKDEF
ncbi:CRISPR-associated endonuclease Cas1 [Thermovirga sp.]|uniref:CRISPR-associated endonuclease Cas1 n=1 Tax=Thermovirga sp. TaxID=2699834 RepID=UPI00345B1854|nr:CRISPR-associated endonuclease Cas1 [Thermovirga sp.]